MGWKRTMRAVSTGYPSNRIEEIGGKEGMARHAGNQGTWKAVGQEPTKTRLESRKFLHWKVFLGTWGGKSWGKTSFYRRKWGRKKKSGKQPRKKTVKRRRKKGRNNKRSLKREPVVLVWGGRGV